MANLVGETGQPKLDWLPGDLLMMTLVFFVTHALKQSIIYFSNVPSLVLSGKLPLAGVKSTRMCYHGQEKLVGSQKSY